MNQHLYIIGYHPLLDTNRIPGSLLDKGDSEKFINEMRGIYDKSVDGCMWGVAEDGSLALALMIEQAEEVAEHLIKWSENKPTEWFKLYIAWEDPSRYCVALMPNPRKSVERFKVARMMFHDDLPDSDDKYTVIFSPLIVCSAGSTFSAHVADKLRGELVVYTTETGPVKEGRMDGKRHFIGKFAIPPEQLGKAALENEEYGSYLRDHLDDM